MKESSKPGGQKKTEDEDDYIFESPEFAGLSDGVDSDAVKRDARRKIEIYWEKKRLKELFDDIDESEFGF
jgi:hypothetical protein